LGSIEGKVSERPLGQAGGPVYQSVRSVLDWVVALPLLIICAPVFLAIVIAIRLDSDGPAFFRQDRIGKAGRPFSMLKFRTMRIEAPAYSLKVEEASLIITRVGRFLRGTGLDELPQLLNVLRGEMAMIGPRPEQAALIELYEPWQHQRHLVKPGITGWWQIHHRDGLPLHLNVEKDLYYIQHQGPWIDATIVAGTLKIIVGGLLAAVRGRRGRGAAVAFAETVAQEGENP